MLLRVQELKGDAQFSGLRNGGTSRGLIAVQPSDTQLLLRPMAMHHLMAALRLTLHANQTPTEGQLQPAKVRKWCDIDLPNVLAEGFDPSQFVIVHER
jgi:hypothetical protein